MIPSLTHRFQKTDRHLIVQILWWCGTLFVISMGLVSIIYRYQIEINSTRVLFAESLRRFSIQPEIYAVSRILTDVVTLVVSCSAGIFLFLKQSRIKLILFVSEMLILFGGTLSISYTLAYLPPALAVIGIVLRGLSNVSLILFCFTFPDGRFIPPWSKYIVGMSFFLFYGAILLDSQLTTLATSLDLPLFSLSLIVVIIAQTYRYRKNASAEERQQTKWALLAFFVATFGTLLFTVIDFPLTPWLREHPDVRLIYRLVFPVLTIYVSALLLPIILVFSVSRSRLWQVDLTINRSLVYGLVTVILLLMFGGIFGVLQLALSNKFDPNIVVLAGAVGAVITGLAFRPLQQRIQSLIDRRVYGFRFDLNQLERVETPQEVKHHGKLTGQQIAGYQILDILGQGGMGEVYKGFRNGQYVAIKILAPNLALDETFRVRFEREAEVLQSLHHQYIVEIYHAGKQDDLYYIIMEYVAGEDLSILIKRRELLPLAEILPLLKEFAIALDYAHAQGFVHRDIKPSNIMLRQTDENSLKPVLMDFGLAKMKNLRTNITGSGAIGTIRYMAPEQIMAANEVDYRADIYALGVVIYELLTGECPFIGNPAQILFAHLQQPIPDPRKKVPGLPYQVVEAIQRAMSKNPDSRFQTASDFAFALTYST